jgi:NADH dehydrogenase FAD-containing subunit
MCCAQGRTQMTRFSNSQHDTIFKLGEMRGAHAAKSGDVPDLAAMAHQEAAQYANENCFVENGQERLITQFEERLYAAGVVGGFKKARRGH